MITFLLLSVYIPTVSERSLLEGQSTSSAVSDLPAEGFKKSGSEKASSRSSQKSVDTDSTLGGVSVHSIHRYGLVNTLAHTDICIWTVSCMYLHAIFNVDIVEVLK